MSASFSSSPSPWPSSPIYTSTSSPSSSPPLSSPSSSSSSPSPPPSSPSSSLSSSSSGRSMQPPIYRKCSSVALRPFIVVPSNVLPVSTYHEFLDRAPLPQELQHTLHAMADHTLVAKRHLGTSAASIFSSGSADASFSHKYYESACYALFKQSAIGALAEANLSPPDITAIVAVSCTGCSMPALSARLIADLGFNPSVQHVPVSQWGCAGGVAALKLADKLCRADPTEAVLVLCAEVCSSMYHAEMDKSSMICASLFADAGSGCIVLGLESDLLQRVPASPAFFMQKGHEHIIPESEKWMSYSMDARGLHFRLGKEVGGSMPKAAPLVANFLQHCGHNLEEEEEHSDPDLTLIAHTGGPKILRELLQFLYPKSVVAPAPVETSESGEGESKVELEVEDYASRELGSLEGPRVRASLDVLRNFGNIASVTIFVSLRDTLIAKLTDASFSTSPALILGCGPGMGVQQLYGHIKPLNERCSPPPPLPSAAVALVLPPLHTSKASFDVAIIGGGPVGKALALMLKNQGMTVALVEKNVAEYEHPRADHIDSSTLRILSRIGVTDELRRQDCLRPCLEKQVIVNDMEPIVLDLPRQLKQFGDGGFAPTNTFCQVALDSCLRQKVLSNTDNDSSGGSITALFGFNAVDVTSDPLSKSENKEESIHRRIILEYGVTGTKHEIRADYIVGCDGAHSLVRQSCFGPAESRAQIPAVQLVQADYVGGEGIDLGLPDIITQTTVGKGDSLRHVAIVPAHINHRVRLVFSSLHTDSGFEGSQRYAVSDSQAACDLLTSLVSTHFPTVARNAKLLRAAVYSIRPSCEPKWCTDATDVILAGDAAHTMLPFMGQGLCMGFRDAEALWWRLSYVRAGFAPRTLISVGYQEENRTHCLKLLKASYEVRQCVMDIAAGKGDPRNHVYNKDVDFTRRQLWPQPKQTSNSNYEHDWIGCLMPRVLLHRNGSDSVFWSDTSSQSKASSSNSIPAFELWCANRVADSWFRSVLQELGVRSPCLVLRSLADFTLEKHPATANSVATLHRVLSDDRIALIRPDGFILATWPSVVLCNAEEVAAILLRSLCMDVESIAPQAL